MKRILLFICITGIWVCAVQATESWTWLHRKRFLPEEVESNKQKTDIVFVKTDLPNFSQLLFSWNAFRPEKGHFSFYVQARDAATKKWSKWHKMMEWGAGIQRSYMTLRDDTTQYVHVRLETLANGFADSFAIKIEAYHGADLSLLRSFCINLSDFSKFTSEMSAEHVKKLSSVHISGVPMISQFELDHPRNDGLCSPTSCSILASYLTQKPIDPIDFAEKSFDTGLDKYGSWPLNMAHAFERCEGLVYFAAGRLPSFTGLHELLRKGIPVAVSVRGSIEGAPRVYHHGHLLVVVGYDGKRKEVICHDPAAPCKEETMKRYKLSNFLNAWERSHRLAYLADPAKMV